MSVVVTRVQAEDLLHDVDVVRYVEPVLAVLVAEQEVKVVKPGPGNGRHAHGARLVGG